MKKIIIVGHNQENNERLETLFQHLGMQKALPSRREGLTPIQVGELLKKAMKTEKSLPLENETISSTKRLENISKRRLKKHIQKQNQSSISTTLPKSMWDYIPMDLMIANIDNEFWGWADKNALEHLEYWKALDPSILFVLTYDKPQSLLEYLENKNSLTNKEDIISNLNDWNAYNLEMLSFFEKNSDRAILISNERVNEQTHHSIKAIYEKISPPEFHYNPIVQFENMDIQCKKENPSLSSIIVDNIIQNSPGIWETYSKLHENSDFPIKESIIGTLGSLDNAFDAWKEYKKNNEILKEQGNIIQVKENLLQESSRKSQEKDLIIKTLYEENQEHLLVNQEKELKIQSLFGENKHFLSENETLTKQLKKSQGEVGELSAKHQKISEDYQKVKMDKELVDTQLNIVLEKLEKVSIEKQNIQNTYFESQKEKQEILLKNKSKEEILIKEKEELLQEHKSATNENQDLLFQLHLVQEELEKLFLENKKLKDSPPLLGAANRIRNQLSYRIGSTLVKQGTTLFGWLCMPISLYRVYLEYKREYRKNRWQKLPSLDRYQDAYEAEKIKNHLSYKLGKLFLENIKNPINWFILPFKISKKIKEHNKK